MTSLSDSDGDSIAVAGPLVTFMSDSLTFAGVAAAHAGTAWLTLSAVANGSTQLNMIVNGDAATEVDIAPGYIPNALQSQVVPVLLQAGDNTITFTDFSESAVPVYLGSISVTQPATVYEAEAPGNTLAGGAVRVLSSASPPANWSQEAWDSSGRAYVGDLGGSYDGTLQINGIQSATAGEHLLSISVIVSGTRVMWIGADTENGQQLQEVTVTGTSWNTPEVIQVPVFLQAMSGNFIYFQGDGLGDPMPDIDALSIS